MSRRIFLYLVPVFIFVALAAGMLIIPSRSFLQEFQTIIAAILALFAAILSGAAILHSARLQAEATGHATLSAAKQAEEDRQHQANRQIEQLKFNEKSIVEKERRELLRRRATLAGALGGEITAIVNLIERRKMVVEFQNFANLLDQNPDSHIAMVKFPIAEEYFTVFKNSSAELGVFSKHLAGEVAYYYTRMIGIKDFLRAIMSGFYDMGGNPEKADTCRTVANDIGSLLAEAPRILQLLHDDRKAALSELGEDPGPDLFNS